MIVFDLDSIGVWYGPRRVLSAASLRARAGGVTALIGRNGTGKTSLLQAGVGLQRFTHGSVRLNGVLYLRPRLATLARAGLFYLPARNILEPTLPVRRQLAAISQYFAGPAVEYVIDLLRLGAVAHQAPQTLSGGELRRAEVAAAIARRPKCLVADEPFRGLDPRDIDLLAGSLRALAGDGAAVVITGHELTTVRAVADAVVWCAGGTTREFPIAADAWSDAQLQDEFLGAGRG